MLKLYFVSNGILILSNVVLGQLTEGIAKKYFALRHLGSVPCIIFQNLSLIKIVYRFHNTFYLDVICLHSRCFCALSISKQFNLVT